MQEVEMSKENVVGYVQTGRKLRGDLSLLLALLPEPVLKSLEKQPDLEEIVEVVLDLGRTPEARFPGRAVYLEELEVSREDLEQVVSRLGDFSGDNRAGIERTLHRISAIRNRRREIVGLTCRIGRAITGTVDIIRDVIETGESLLLMGAPGVGKTTLLREAARVLADELQRRVVVVDTSNEIAGDGDVPHPAIGHARRMQVPSPELQHKVMIEAVENHMPEVIVIDEIGSELEAVAARTIAERGVQLVATAHGITLQNLIVNPTLSDLIGGVQAVTLSDEEARRRGTQKTVLERKAPPTFDTLVEIQDRNRLAIYSDLAKVVDRVLTGSVFRPQIRVRGPSGAVEIEGSNPSEPDMGHLDSTLQPGDSEAGTKRWASRRRPRIFPIGLSRSRLERAIQELGVTIRLADDPLQADILLGIKGQRKRQPRRLREVLEKGGRFYSVRSNTVTQIKAALTDLLGENAKSLSPYDRVGAALHQAEDAVVQVQRSHEAVALSPQNAFLRRLQHDLISGHGLRSESNGKAPLRHVIVFPDSPSLEP